MKRLAPVLGVVAGIAIWVGFIAGYNVGWWSVSLLPEAASCVAAGGALVASGEWYRRVTGSRLGFGVTAILLLVMAGYTATRTGIVGIGALTVAAIAAGVLAIRGLDHIQESPEAPLDRPSTDRKTRVIWLAAALAFPLTFLVAAVAGAGPGSGVLHVSESVRSGFNLLGILFAPVVALLVLAHGFLCWLSSSRIRPALWRVLAVLAVTGVAAAIPMLAGLAAGQPFIILTYLLPITATTVYVLAFPASRMMRVLGVAALAVAIGLSLFMVGSALVGAETD